VFELWDTCNARLVGTFASESAALDAAYRELRGRAQSNDPASQSRPRLAVLLAPGAGTPTARARWTRLESALRGLSLRLV
jgi:hypothetical protein